MEKRKIFHKVPEGWKIENLHKGWKNTKSSRRIEKLKIFLKDGKTQKLPEGWKNEKSS